MIQLNNDSFGVHTHYCMQISNLHILHYYIVNIYNTCIALINIYSLCTHITCSNNTLQPALHHPGTVVLCTTHSLRSAGAVRVNDLHHVTGRH